MEEVYGSECSSGCESGWTLYLEHSMYPTHSFQNHNNNNNNNNNNNGDDFIYKKSSFSYGNGDEDEEEEEDMSMVSDASSGPPHFQEQEQEHECFNKIITNGKRQKIPKEPSLCRKVQEHLPSFLDDTASSPFFNISNNNLTVGKKKDSMEENDIIDYSQGYSTTYYEGKPAFQDQFGYFHPSVSGNQLQQNQWFEEKRWGV